MLSILIPTYNYNIVPLVEELYNQVSTLNIDFEILVLDDGSTLFTKENSEINTLKNCSYKTNTENFGRSITRNLLAKYAKFDWLLFLDADTLPKDNLFISNYINYFDTNYKAINGGIVYQENSPAKNQMLRWNYGTKREALPFQKRNENPYQSFLTLNFLIHRDVFKTVSFNDKIPNLRHEDTLFSFELSKHQIKTLHINNSVIHYGLDTNEIFLKKSKEAVENLKYLHDKNLITSDYVKLLNLAVKIKSIGLKGVFGSFYKTFRKPLEQKILNEKSSIYLFDFYRLCYFCSL